ncbi:unnamed protein product [Haemonchus placei]|uniref:RRM domain-containing protein n=1 Tax=Haemonchus placei TaxID=6290 RepID=A0A158QMF5_HAEPC|nr:unnamed protein product [Haemonchus placei]
MSVIIRLQLLPLSANAADVRAFFSGLRIPDGAVHIVGGDDGDAFIGFATDEDARQAMRRDRGQIHGEERFGYETEKKIALKALVDSRDSECTPHHWNKCLNALMSLKIPLEVLDNASVFSVF